MSKGVNFFQTIISSIMGGNSPEAVKKRMLKNIAKALSKTKFHFYKISQKEAEPAMAKFFYDIYKAVSPAQIMFQNINPASLKQVVISATLSDRQHVLLESLSEEAVYESSKSVPIEELKAKTAKDYSEFSKEFTSEKIKSTDALYSKLMAFYNFCTYDFYFILKKFDSSMRERNFNSLPKFQPIIGEYIVEEIKNFTSVAWALPLEASWDNLFELLKNLKGVEPVALNVWKKIIARLSTLKAEGVFEMIVQLISDDPFYKEKARPEALHITEEYIQGIKKQVDTAVEEIKKRQTESKIEHLAAEIFTTTNVEPLKNYNTDANELFEKKNFKGYMYCDALKYLKLFLLDFTKKSIRELSDILLVRGKWSNQQMATPMSEAFHRLLSMSDNIIKMDEKLADNGEWGMKIRTLLPRCERDKEARNIINMVIGDANEEAAQLITASVKYYVTYAKNLKMVLEDFLKGAHSTLIINWKELDRFSEGKLKANAIEIYKKIFTLVQLMQSYNVQLRTAPRY